MKIKEIKKELLKNPRTWLVTGAAGFIGSNLLEELLKLEQKIIGLDNFSTGHRHNLDDVRTQVNEKMWKQFTFIEGDIRKIEDCHNACKGVDFVLHQAALGSVPRSIEDPVTSNQANVDGFINMLIAARDAGNLRFVFASSSATYGDHPGLPKVESKIGRPLSPYAVTKYTNELYADVFTLNYEMECIGLRYFNVFGRRQDPKGAYAAVIPRWISEFLNDNIPVINGDGETSRDFCYVENIVDANILAATENNSEAINQVYNIACGARTTLNELFHLIQSCLEKFKPNVTDIRPKYVDFRPGDVLHSHADVSKAGKLLKYAPLYDVSRGMNEVISWYVNNTAQH